LEKKRKEKKRKEKKRKLKNKYSALGEIKEAPGLQQFKVG